jgi:hypothetical protein
VTPDFNVSTPSPSVSVKAGQTVGIPLTLTSTGGFAGTVTPAALNWSGIGTTSSSWSPTTIGLTANGTASSTFSLVTSSTATPGTYTITLQASSGIPLYHFRSEPDSDTDLSVCIDPQTAIPLLRGLHWKNGDLEYDLERDRARFWEPVEQSLREPAQATNSQCHNTADDAHAEPTRQTLDGITYIDSLTASLSWWAHEKQVLQNAIQV